MLCLEGVEVGAGGATAAMAGNRHEVVVAVYEKNATVLGAYARHTSDWGRLRHT